MQELTKTMLSVEEYREYKERSELLALRTAVERAIPARKVSRGQSPMELLTPRELSKTTEVRSVEEQSQTQATP